VILCDTHIHLGASRDGRPIKVSASKNLTLAEIPAALRRYGADLGAVVDLATRRGLADLEAALAAGALSETADGTFRDAAGTHVLGALEAEFRLSGAGPFHVLAYVPGLDALRSLARIYREAVKNPDLSTQRLHLEPDAFRHEVEAIGGSIALAHAFTPHRGLFGAGLGLRDAFADPAGLGLELGLSADVEIARQVGEVGELGLMGGSDAHGPETIGRELNLVPGPAGYAAVLRLVRGEADTIFGMNPAFGKYHRTYCLHCEQVVADRPPQLRCPVEPGHRVVAGVLDRAMAMAPPQGERDFPRYVYQLPLTLLPGFGAVARRRLVAAFGSVHRGLHEASAEQLRGAVGAGPAEAVLAMRRGEPPRAVGGGGRWGKADS